MSNPSIENQLFTWAEWDESPEPGDSIFYDVELNQALGTFQKGHKFFMCNYCPSIGVVEFFDEQSKDSESGYVFQLVLYAVPYNSNVNKD